MNSPDSCRSSKTVTDERVNELARYFEAYPQEDGDAEIALALRDLERLREEDRQWDKTSLVAIVRERDRLRELLWRIQPILNAGSEVAFKVEREIGSVHTNRDQPQLVETSGEHQTLGDGNARQASLAGDPADTSNVEPRNLADIGRGVSGRSDQQQPASHAARMFRSYPAASGVADLIRSRLFQTFLGQGFWHAHHVDLIWRYNGQDVREEADWLKDLWYAIRGAEKSNCIDPPARGSISKNPQP